MKKLLRKVANRVSDEIYKSLYAKEYSGCTRDKHDIETHIHEAVNWLKRAQDSGIDRGVSYGANFGQGFQASYPETTGYIIPTFLKLFDTYRDRDFFNRAVRMGEWEIAIQMESGAVMGGKANLNPTPAVFNTGMVLLGWSELFRRTQNRAFFDAAKKAADWLVNVQERDGSWKKFNSIFANPNITVYNVKVGWGLALFGRLTDNADYIEAATKSAEYTLGKQTTNGWYEDCCLDDARNPLLHTIAYATQGLLEIGNLVAAQVYISAARRTADSVLELMDDSGFIPGRISCDFKGAADWCCLTGSAQCSIIFWRLFELFEDPNYRKAGQLLNQYLMKRHDITSKNPAIRGGVPGSWPVWGDYGKFMILNWATKFLIDALLAEKAEANAQVTHFETH